MTWVLIDSITLEKYPVYFPLDSLARHIHTFLPFTSIMQKTSLSEVWFGSLGVPSKSDVSQSKNFKLGLMTPLINAAPRLSWTELWV
jgi:hypothetical protein